MKIQTRNLLPIALAGDFAALLLFLFLGASSHASGVSLDAFARTVVPFAAAWVAVGVAAKAFTPAVIRSPQRALRVIPGAWLAAGLLGVAIRWLLFDRFDVTFSLVAIGVMGVTLLIWRLALAVVRR